MGTLIGAGAFTPSTAADAVAQGTYDMIAFGRWFLSNPDLPDRIKAGRALNVYDRSTFYGKGPTGYVDCSVWGAVHGDLPSRFRLMSQDRLRSSLRAAGVSAAT